MTAPAPGIRWATAADADTMARVHAACFDDPWDAEACRTLLEMPGAFAVLAEDADAVRGFILCRVAADEAEVLSLAVLPNARCRSLGRTLLLEAMGMARVLGAQQLYLEVGESNAAALRLYETAGLRINGRRRGYYRAAGSPPVDALTMSTAL